MFVAAAVCPHPPLLVPAVSVVEPDWLRELRTACQRAVSDLLRARPDVVAVIGAGPATQTWDATAGGSLRSYGVDVRAGGAELALPLSLVVGAWLLDESGWSGPRAYAALSAATTAEECSAIGAELVSPSERVALLVMGDGSAKRTTESPGYLDRRAGGFDAAVADALANADGDALMKVDAGLADELWVAGRQAWQALAGAAHTTSQPVDATLLFDAAPRGVGYHVATWLPAGGR